MKIDADLEALVKKVEDGDVKAGDNSLGTLSSEVFEAMTLFPRVLGVELSHLALNLVLIDDALDDIAALQKKDATKIKEALHLVWFYAGNLEGSLTRAKEDKPADTPAGAIEAAANIAKDAKALRAKIDKYEGTKAELTLAEIKTEAAKVATYKHERFIDKYLKGKVFNLATYPLLRLVRQVEDAASRVRSAKEKDDVLAALAGLRKVKEKLLAELKEANPPPKPKCAKRVGSCLYSYTFAGTAAAPALGVTWAVTQTNSGTSSGSFGVVAGRACGPDPLRASWTISQQASTSQNRLNTLTVHFDAFNPYTVYIGSYSNAGNIEVKLLLSSKPKPRLSLVVSAPPAVFSNVVVTPAGGIAVTQKLVKVCP